MTKDARELLIESAIAMRNATLKAKIHGVIGYQNKCKDGQYFDEFQIFSVSRFKELAAAAKKQYIIEPWKYDKYVYRYTVEIDGMNFVCIESKLHDENDKQFIINVGEK